MTERPPPPEAAGKKRGPSKVLVPVVLIVGALLGFALSAYVPLPYEAGPFGFQFYFQLRNLMVVHTILSTVSIALLVTIVAVYAQIYAQTKARFSLGILVVMFALLFQSVFQYPLLLGYVGTFSEVFGPYFSAADIFTVVAYTILLYLSLE
ncbi:MAG: hypothetical protein JRN11_07440 [Nitrososphaerota archaeon]|nr:hypothetical protein [Nitrososphaerota archaeon]MDG7026564.1 hypothetical protein [Nitrososphaerota archaeon]